MDCRALAQITTFNVGYWAHPCLLQKDGQRLFWVGA